MEGHGKIVLLNGNANGKNRVSSATVYINGLKIFGSNDFNQNIDRLEAVINLTDSNSVQVELSSKPGSYVSMEITQDIPEPVLTFNANPETIIKGESTTFGWTTENADTCTIEPNIGSIDPSGSMTEKPDQTTTYTITATGPGGTKSASVTITVLVPPTVNITATPEQIIRDESTTLSWIIENAEYCTIEPNVGEFNESGTITVSPLETTVYTITAVGQGGSASANLTVEVVLPPLPTLTFSANPLIVNQGETTTLSWATNDAVSVYIDKIGMVQANGSQSLTMEHTTVYTITASNISGTTSAQVIVKVVGNTIPLPENSWAAQYQDLIPEDATINAYDPERFSIITGVVNNVDATPLEDVTISVYEHPEYGTVKTDSQGNYSLPVEHGILTLIYQKEGKLTVHREIPVTKNDVITADKVYLSNEDTKATSIFFDGNPGNVMIHRSTPIPGANGEHACTLVFTGDNHAYATDENGQDLFELKSILVRATEYSNESFYPYNIPSDNVLSYAFEFTVDGVNNIRFDKPIIAWIENYKNIEVGQTVSVSHFDRNNNTLNVDPDGIVVRLLDTDSDGIVDALDTDEDGQPDDINNSGNYKDEVLGLDDATKYIPNSTFVRLETSHFTPFFVLFIDYNYQPSFDFYGAASQVYTDELYEFLILIFDARGTFLQPGTPFLVTSPNLPDGATLVINGNYRYLSWQPALDQVGEHNINFIFDNGQQSYSQTITVNVLPSEPTVNLTIIPGIINQGENFVISWASTSASSCDIQPGIGLVDPNGQIEISSDGSYSFPSEDTVYTITAIGPGGTATDAAQINVLDDGKPVFFEDNFDYNDLNNWDLVTGTWSNYGIISSEFGVMHSLTLFSDPSVALIKKAELRNFVLESDIKMCGVSNAGLIFRVQDLNGTNFKGYYVGIGTYSDSYETETGIVLKKINGDNSEILAAKKIPLGDALCNEWLHLKIVAYEDTFQVYINDNPLNTNPFPKFDIKDNGANKYMEGRFGVINYGCSVEFDNVKISEYVPQAQESYINPLSYKEPLDNSENILLGADPYILFYNNTYYLYATRMMDGYCYCDEYSPNEGEIAENCGFDVYTSTDLINWVKHTEKALKRADTWGNCFFWGPEVMESSGKFYMYYTAQECPNGIYTGETHIAVAIADSPLGPFLQANHGYMNFDGLVSDGHIFSDDDGKKYLYFSPSNHEIQVAEIDADLISIKSNSITPMKIEDSSGIIRNNFTATQVWENSPVYMKDTGQTVTGNIAEGAFVIKHNNVYYLSYSGNPYSSKEYAVGYATSNSPIGPWKKYEYNPILKYNNIMEGTGHHSFVCSPDGSEMFIVYHTHKNDEIVNPRKISIDKVQFVPQYNGPDTIEVWGPTNTPQPVPIIDNSIESDVYLQIIYSSTATGDKSWLINDYVQSGDSIQLDLGDLNKLEFIFINASEKSSECYDEIYLQITNLEFQVDGVWQSYTDLSNWDIQDDRWTSTTYLWLYPVGGWNIDFIPSAVRFSYKVFGINPHECYSGGW